jgi:hypothetical protein
MKKALLLAVALSLFITSCGNVPSTQPSTTHRHVNTQTEVGRREIYSKVSPLKLRQTVTHQKPWR